MHDAIWGSQGAGEATREPEGEPGVEDSGFSRRFEAFLTRPAAPSPGPAEEEDSSGFSPAARKGFAPAATRPPRSQYAHYEDADIHDVAKELDEPIFQSLLQSSTRIEDLRRQLGEDSIGFLVDPGEMERDFQQLGAEGDKRLSMMQEGMAEMGRKMQEAVRKSETLIRNSDEYIERRSRRSNGSQPGGAAGRGSLPLGGSERVSGAGVVGPRTRAIKERFPARA